MTRTSATPRRDPSRWFGALGVLAIVIVAAIGWIAYRANSGLPGQGRYDVNVLVPDADRLINAADVRVGGVLVGEVLNVSAVPGPTGGPPRARVELGLDGTVRLPVDSTVQIRPASVLGLTYVDLHLGRSRRMVAAGGTLRLAQAKPASDLTDLFHVFNARSARAFQSAISGAAYGLAGRGAALNQTIAASAALMPALDDVAGVLAAPSTRLSPFLGAYESVVNALGPVSGQLTGLVAGGARTLGAIAGARHGLAAAIDAAPGAETAVTTAFVRVRPALDGLSELATRLRPAGALLPATLDQVNSTLSAGVPALRQLPGFSQPLRTALTTLEALARDPNTTNSLRKLHDLIIPTNTLLATAVPAQVDCNVLANWGQGWYAVFGQNGDGQGPALPNLTLTGAGAIGEPLQNPKPSPNLGLNPLPNENASECEAGNEPWSGKQQLNNPPGLQSRSTRTTTPPPGVPALARSAGLLTPIPGAH